MRRGPAVVVGVAWVCVLVGAAPGAAAVPSNPNDPCARAGRDTCGTTGIGFYRDSPYGTRWFGDYHGAVPGQRHAFCIDLRFWYASRAYRYREDTSTALRNKSGEVVSPENQAKLSYAIWTYGRGTAPSRQAAVMVYVHSLMGEARPREIDPDELGPRVAAFHRSIARAAARYHGPYRIQTRLDSELTVGRPATVTLRVLSARGYPLPRTQLAAWAQGAHVSREVLTDVSGRAEVELTPTAVEVELRIATTPLAASRPRIFVPSTAVAAPNGQRLAVPSAARVTALVRVRARPVVAAMTSSRLVRPGAPMSERIRIPGLGRDTATVDVQLFGPFASRSKIACRGTPLWHRRLTVAGSGETTSPSVTVKRAGYYAYRERIVGPASLVSSGSSCGAASETTLAVPQIVTGRGDVSREVTLAGAGPATPVRLRIPRLGIDAPVAPAGIDVERGVLAVPKAITRTGWWRDGSTPGSRVGTVLIAGHVDSARAGRGAFFALPRARVGEQARVETADGQVHSYSVVSVRSYPKSALPASVFSADGVARLVLVTCGGRFDQATGHYRDNIVVTAVPG